MLLSVPFICHAWSILCTYIGMTASFLHAGNQASLYYPQSGECDVYYDIHSRRRYQSLVSFDQVGIFFNTDGISPFKSSETIWFKMVSKLNAPIKLSTAFKVVQCFLTSKPCSQSSYRLYALCSGRSNEEAHWKVGGFLDTRVLHW